MIDLTGSRGQDQVMVRMPDGMRDMLQDAAKANARSANSEIVARLAASFTTSQALPAAVAEFLEKHINQEVQSRLRAIAAKIGGEA